MKSIIKIALTESHILPTRAHVDDVGLDLTAHHISISDRSQSEVKTFLVSFGVCVEPPPNYYVELIPRSSLAWTGFMMPNSIGVIDPGYRGELMMPLIYLGDADRAEERARSLVGRRLAQLVLRRLHHADVVEVPRESLTQTARGEGAFGSSGR